MYCAFSVEIFQNQLTAEEYWFITDVITKTPLTIVSYFESNLLKVIAAYLN